jgi:hypothetical protein
LRLVAVNPVTAFARRPASAEDAEARRLRICRLGRPHTFRHPAYRIEFMLTDAGPPSVVVHFDTSGVL